MELLVIIIIIIFINSFLLVLHILVALGEFMTCDGRPGFDSLQKREFSAPFSIQSSSKMRWAQQ
jgi:hypothetical protein